MGLTCERLRRFPVDRHRSVLRSHLRDCPMPSNHGGGIGSLTGLIRIFLLNSSLVMRARQRFESARRLSPIGLVKPNAWNREGPRFVAGGFLTLTG